MFTGIVQTKLPVFTLDRRDDFATFTFEFPEQLLAGLQCGASVAINGTCLTVRTIDGHKVSFDAIGQTLRVTNLGALIQGSVVNIERAARFGDEIGGHVLSGHIMDQVEVLAVDDSADNRVVWMQRPAHLAMFLLDKGFVALNGCSLTIAQVEDDRFSVHLIPETRDVTTFGDVVAGNKINLEVDAQTQAVVETVRRLLGDGKLLADLTKTLSA
ncbi:riboflavin synthase subunit alpha [Thalassolituus sp. LLYu03]|uniref:riboflavin synthase subunit alpha n=1 Tax=Thalassolituus sp. LLYu03 TaxID=3421656 RepID=UPI003D2AE5FD